MAMNEEEREKVNRQQNEEAANEQEQENQEAVQQQQQQSALQRNSIESDDEQSKEEKESRNKHDESSSVEKATKMAETAKKAESVARTGIKLAKSPVAVIIIIAVIVILALIGIISFFTTMPQFMWNRLKQIAVDLWDGFQGYIIGMDEASVNNSDIIYVGQYLYDMGYDLVGMGFAESVVIAGEPAIISEHGLSTSQITSANPWEFKDLELLQSVKDGYIYKPTDEIPKGQIVAMDAPFLRAYLVAENRTYLINNYTYNLKDYYSSFINGSFFSEGHKVWGTGLIHLDRGLTDALRMKYDAIRVGELNLGELIDGVKIDRETNTLRIRRLNLEAMILDSHFDYTTFNLSGWSGRYGKPFELLLTIHQATMAPDLVKEIAMNPKLDAKVNVKLRDTDFNGKVYVDGKSIAELEAEGAYDEETIKALKDLENGRASEIKTSIPYISSVTNHWFRNVYFEGTSSIGAKNGVQVGIDEDEDGIEDYNEERGLNKTQKTRALSSSDNVYSFQTTTEEMDYTGDPIPGVEGKITFRGNVLNGVSQNKDAVRGVTNPTTKKLFTDKYYIYDGTVARAKAIQDARAKKDDSLKEEIRFTKESLHAFTILEESESLDSQYIYRDLKELVIELGYFEREDFEIIESQVLEWPLPDFKRKGWPDKKYEKQIIEYGTVMLCEESVDLIREKEKEDSDAGATSTASSGYQTPPYNDDVGKADFKPETRAIVDAHKNDFNVDNFHSKMNSYGGYENYVKSLGGVFERYAGEDNIAEVTTVEELIDVSEYVYGLMTIWGFDYSNGDPGHYGIWGANNSAVKDDGFYKGRTNGATGSCASPRDSIDGRCSAKKGLSNMTTNCNWSVDLCYFKAGLFSFKDTSKPTSSCDLGDLMSHGGETIETIEELQPGDIIECYRNPVPNKSDTSTWRDSKWYHVCFVGERNDTERTITLYDGGHFFTNSGYYKNVIKLDNPGWPLDNNGWGAIRLSNLGYGLVGYPEDLDVIAMGDGIVKAVLTEENNPYTYSTISRKIDGTEAEEPEYFYKPSEQTLEGIVIKLSGDTKLKGYTLTVYGFDLDEDIAIGKKLKTGDVIGKTIKSNMCFILQDRDKAVVENIEDFIKVPEGNQDLRMEDDFDVSDSSNFVTDIEQFKKMFAGYTNIINNAEAFMQMQEKYQVNAVFAACVTIAESSGGTAWAAISPSTHNWFSIKGSYNGSSLNGWRSYPSFAVAVDDFGNLIANGSYYYKQGKKKVSQIGPTYCNEQWAVTVNQLMADKYKKIVN